MDKNRSSALLAVLVCFGIVIFALNSIFFYTGVSDGPIYYGLLVGHVIQIALGVVISIFSIKITKKAYQFFIGLILSGWGLLSGLISFVLPYGVMSWWPYYLILAGVFLAISGCFKYRKIKFGYIFPSIVLVIMGFWFSLFSLKILKVSFKNVVILLGPAFIVLIAISLVLVFLIQKYHKKLIVCDDDSGDFDDEELSFPKLD